MREFAYGYVTNAPVKSQTFARAEYVSALKPETGSLGRPRRAKFPLQALQLAWLKPRTPGPTRLVYRGA